MRKLSLSAVTVALLGAVVFAVMWGLPADSASGDIYITTIAGNGGHGYNGDNIPATNATLGAAVGGIAYDAAGNLYIGDDTNNRIRRVNTAGTITTVAGTGAPGYTGDGGQATAATLWSPKGLAVDAANNIYFADRDNSVVRKITSGGVISTFHAMLGPDAVLIGPGNTIIVFSGFEHTIKVLDSSGAVVRTITDNTGDLRINFGGIAVDPAGVIYHSDIELEQVITIATDGTMTRIGGVGDGIEGYAGDGGLASSARFRDVGGIVVDVAGAIEPAGTVIVADRGNARLRAIRTDGTIRTIAGNGNAVFCGQNMLATFASLEGPWGLAFAPSGPLSFLDNTRVRQLTSVLAPPPGPTPTPCPTPTFTPSAPTPLPSTPTPSVFTPSPTPTFVPPTPTFTPFTPSGNPPTFTPTATGTPTATPVTSPGDLDGDGVPNASDNCPSNHNPDQTNTDAAPLFGAPFSSPPPTITPPNDHTRPNGDALGDLCDPDDDNDGLTDIVEEQLGVPSPPGPCVLATSQTNTLLQDTDGDRIIDGAECVLGSNPVNAASVPATCAAQGKPDTDADRLCNDFETVIGTLANNPDTDGDKIPDGVEYRGYGSSPLLTDTDSDGCTDGREIASVNVDTVVNSLDLGIIASQFGRADRPVQDIDKNSTVNSSDLLIVATNFNNTPC